MRIDEWDVVDVDAVREEERRMQKTEGITVGDTKAYVAGAVALTSSERILDFQREQLRQAMRRKMESNAVDACLAARQNAAELRLRHIEAAITAKRDRIAALKSSNAAKRLELDARTRACEADRRALTERKARESHSGERATQLAAIQQELAARRKVLMSGIDSAFPLTAESICGARVPDNDAGPETEEHAVALGHAAHLLLVFCSISNCPLPHPVHLSSSRTMISERPGVAEDKRLPLFPAKGVDRAQLRRAVELLKGNVLSAALTVHKQQQAEGLPLLLALQKLVENR